MSVEGAELPIAESPFDTITGLPVHALVVHAVVVLLPLTALGAVVIALSPPLSRRFAVLVWPLALLGTVAAVVAQLSGEQLAARVGLPTRHAELGMWVTWAGLALTLASAALWAADRSGQPRGTRRLLAAVVIVVAVATTALVAATGDAGARAVWEHTVDSTSPSG